ncbi:MAG: hypothetical protein IJX99_05655 [Clostridia bacterium]|nr:hypothetical protein [Clostridia bacterium]
MTEIQLFYPLLFVLAIIIVFVLARVYNDKLNFKKDIHFKNKDVEITSEAFKRIGEVKDGTPNEVILNLQNVENNKEIYLHDKKIDELEEKVEFLLNENGDLRAAYKILQSKFDALTKIVGREI